jgi:hypothetical protein
MKTEITPLVKLLFCTLIVESFSSDRIQSDNFLLFDLTKLYSEQTRYTFICRL